MLTKLTGEIISVYTYICTYIHIYVVFHALNLSQHRGLFFNMLALHITWPKYWSFSFSFGPCNEYSGLTSFRIDWFDLLAVQGTIKSLLQHHYSKALILRCSAFLRSNIHIHTWLLEKPYRWLWGSSCGTELTSTLNLALQLL